MFELLALGGTIVGRAHAAWNADGTEGSRRS